MGFTYKSQVIGLLNQLVKGQKTIMAAIDDLTARVTELEAEELQIITDIQTIIANSTGTPDATIEAISARVAAVTAALKAGDPVPPPVTT